jgi:hypothetical protein
VPYSSIFGKVTELEQKKESGWRMSIEVSTGGEKLDVRSETESVKSGAGDVHPERRSEAPESRGETIELGVESDARLGLDGYDQRMPRSLEKAGIYFARPEWDSNYSEFVKDIKPGTNELKKWEFMVEGKLLETKTIRVTGIETIPQTEDVFLVDKERGVKIDLRQKQEYTTEMVKQTMRFEMLVGRRKTIDEEMEKLIPTEIKIGPNYPNPFNPETIIPIELPKTMDVKIVVYDILGRTIKTLYDGSMESGRCYVRWDGRDEQQRKLASGVYLYRMEMSAGRKIVSGKITLVQ